MLDHPGISMTAVLLPPPATPVQLFPRGEAIRQTILNRNPELQLPIQFHFQEEIPSHAGLGSGTQLSLAMLEALLKLHQQPAALVHLAEKCGRGDRSAIGLNGYAQGGFLVDAGHAANGAMGEIACRMDFPEQWRIVVISPHDVTGLHGPEEFAAFRSLPAMPEEISGRLCRLTLTEMLPALNRQQLDPFCRALFEYGQLIGEFFSHTQGGVFASPAMRNLLNQFPDVAGTGMAQSSWGPTIAMFARNDAHAVSLQQQILDLCPDLQTAIRFPRNMGRMLTTSPPHN